MLQILIDAKFGSKFIFRSASRNWAGTHRNISKCPKFKTVQNRKLYYKDYCFDMVNFGGSSQNEFVKKKKTNKQTKETERYNIG